MNQYNCVIIDDEELARNLLENFISRIPELHVVGKFASPINARSVFIEQSVDILFLDIQMPEMTGIEFLQSLTQRPAVVFTTAYDQYAVQACEYSSIGYVLKPINPDNLVQAVNRVRLDKSKAIESRLEIFKGVYNNPNAFEKMSVSALDGIYFLNIRDIVRLEAEDNYTHIFLKSGEKITASKTIKSYEELLQDMNFYRVHKRHVINLNYMRKFVKGDGGYVVMDDDMKIEVSRRRRPAFMEQMKRLQTVI